MKYTLARHIVACTFVGLALLAPNSNACEIHDRECMPGYRWDHQTNACVQIKTEEGDPFAGTSGTSRELLPGGFDDVQPADLVEILTWQSKLFWSPWTITR